MLAWIALYFVLVVCALAMILLPPVRRQVMARTWEGAVRVCTAYRHWTGAAWQAGRSGTHRVGDSLGFHAHDLGRWMAKHAWWTGAGAALVIGLPLLAMALRAHLSLPGFEAPPSPAANRHIAELLQGEQLVPPPPLPPELFETREVEMVRPLTRTASREWRLLDDAFMQRLLLVFKIMKEQHGYDMVLLEGYRSPERQARLAALGGQVTRAGAYQSYHQFGLAADCAFLKGNKVVISERDPWAMRGYELYGQAAQSVGLTWGGNWRSIKDYGHIELRRPGVLGRGQPAGTRASDNPASPEGDENAGWVH